MYACICACSIIYVFIQMDIGHNHACSASLIIGLQDRHIGRIGCGKEEAQEGIL